MKRLGASSILLVFVGSACASQKAWVYAPNPYRDAPVVAKRRAVVVPFEDARENMNSNKLALYMIPLLPYGWADMNVPEGAQMHITSGLWTNYKPTEDFAKALAAELQNSRIFEEAYFDFKRGDADVVVSGKILDTKYKGKILSYGLSLYGPLFWFFGLPAGTITNELSVELSCLEAKSNRELFSKRYSAAPYRKTTWIYSMANDFSYPSLLKEAYDHFLEDLRSQQSLFASRGVRLD